MKLIRIYREQRGWSQAALAEAASVPRATISAIETGRVVPSVEAALAIARALESTVEALFAAGPSAGIDRWARPALAAPVRFWLARVAERMIAYPAESLPTGALAHDGVLGMDGARNISPDARPDDTLVLATCDPAVGLLAEALRARNVRLIALSRPSREALRMLKDGLVHAAGVHFSNQQAPDENKALIFRMLGADSQVLLNYAEWDAGVGVATELTGRSFEQLLNGTHQWINRPKGSVARANLDRIVSELGGLGKAAGRIPGLEREARDHHAVAQIVSSGCAQAGMTLRMSAKEAGIGFKSFVTEHYDICIPERLADDRRIRALLEVVSRRDLRRALSEIPGISTRRTGAMLDV